MLVEILYILFSYTLGSVLGGHIISFLMHKKGFAKNDHPGGAGTARQFGLWAGILTVLIDALKGCIIVMLGRYLELDLMIVVLGALAGVIGHNWPIFFNFRGGGGLAITMGISIFLLPREFILAFPLAIISGYIYSHTLKSRLKISPNPMGGGIGILALLVFSIYFREAQELILLVLGIGILSLVKTAEWKINIRQNNKILTTIKKGGDNNVRSN